MGGANTYIMGSSLDSSASANIVLYSTDTITGSNVDFAPPTMTEDEQFLTASAEGKLSQILPSLEDLTGLSKSSLDSFAAVTFTTSVTTTGPTEKHICSTTSNCYITYRLDYTPVLYDTIPAAVYFDQDV